MSIIEDRGFVYIISPFVSLVNLDEEQDDNDNSSAIMLKIIYEPDESKVHSRLKADDETYSCNISTKPCTHKGDLIKKTIKFILLSSHSIVMYALNNFSIIVLK